MANVSGWTTLLPSGSSSVRHGDDEFRSVKSHAESVVNTEHYWDTASASSASGGIHRKGSARVFTGTRASLSTPASADSDGRLAVSTDLGSLHFLAASSHSTLVWGDSPPGAGASSVATTVGSGTSVNVKIATEDFDVGGYFTAGASAMTVPSGFSGRYLITATARWPSLHTGTRRAIAITAGGALTPVHASQSIGTHNGAGDIGLCISLVRNLTNGDGLSLTAFQDSGGDLSLNSITFVVQRL